MAIVFDYAALRRHSHVGLREYSACISDDAFAHGRPLLPCAISTSDGMAYDISMNGPAYDGSDYLLTAQRRR